MSWSKVYTGEKKPLGWWICKVLCEFGWAIRNVVKSEKYYYFWLNRMVDRYDINLYGKRLNIK